MSTITLRSCAKVNLFLEVRGRRPDGFHELDTVFLELDWGDELRFEREPGGEGVRIACSDPRLPTGADNLITRALSPELERGGGGVRVEVDKALPMGGGLGGGSSNAAAALRALPALFDGDWTDEEVAARALALGSEVPFFLDGGCQRGRGRGEALTPLAAPALDLVLVTPPLHCSTAQVFRALAQRRCYGEQAPDALVAALSAGDVEGVAAAMFNRLEVASFELWPELAEGVAALKAAGCLGALMSGSGSSLFGLAEDARSAAAIAAALPYARAVKALPQRPA